jgi:hypothetical protein
VFDGTPDGAVKGIIRYDIYLNGHFVGSRTHALCHAYLDELMPATPKPGCVSATIHELRRYVDAPERRNRDAGRAAQSIRIVPNDRQDVGRKLRCVRFAGDAHAINGAGGIRSA